MTPEYSQTVLTGLGNGYGLCSVKRQRLAWWQNIEPSLTSCYMGYPSVTLQYHAADGVIENGNEFKILQSTGYYIWTAVADV